jgi:hypothetical protein
MATRAASADGHLARLVEHFAARPQVQERLTKQIPQCLATRLRTPGVGVVLEAEHPCTSLRGVRADGATTVTSALLGPLRADLRGRRESFNAGHNYVLEAVVAGRRWLLPGPSPPGRGNPASLTPQPPSAPYRGRG